MLKSEITDALEKGEWESTYLEEEEYFENGFTEAELVNVPTWLPKEDAE